MPAASALDREGTLLTPHTRRFSWPAVQARFGAGFKDIKHFKPSFREALAAAPWHPSCTGQWRPSALNASLIRAT